MAGNANSPLGGIPLWEGTTGVPVGVPDEWVASVADTPFFKGGALAGGRCVNGFTLRLVGKMEEVIVFLSLSLIEIHITVATNAIRPGPVDVNAVLLPSGPVFLDDLSVAGTALTVCPMSSVGREGGGDMAVVNGGLEALPAPIGAPSVVGL